MDILGRIKGGLYGVAVGDALGGTTEFMSQAEIRNQHGYLTEIVGGGVWKLAPGETTDDTAMTICVAEGILENPDDPMERIGDKFMAWYASDPKDIGALTRYVFREFDGNWFEAAFLADLDMGQSGGNGSLMRCLPVAFGYDKLDDIERVTRLQSKMTHYDERCDEACIFYNRIAFRLLQGERLGEAIRTEIAGTAYADILSGPPDCESSGFVVHTFRWVLHILLAAESFADVVQRAANVGGDTDTIAAIAGGLAGVYYGFEGIPPKYAEAILLRGELDELSEKLLAMRRNQF